MMWDVITDGPIIMYKTGTELVSGADADLVYRHILKLKMEYSSDERKQAGLDNYARNVISSTVTNAYLSKIINCETAKKMWEILAKLCEGSKEIKENKFTIACQKFNNFKWLPNESIEQMQLRFSSIVVDIETIRTGKYTQKEKNLEVLSTLSAEWNTYKVVHQSRSDLSELKSESLFSILKANEYTLNITMEESSRRHNEGELTSTPKEVAFRANSESSKQAVSAESSKRKNKDMSKEELLEEIAMLVRNFNRLNTSKGKPSSSWTHS